ncbi:MAG: hypothetical protein HWN66_14315 [Candidatus Helarchaeota archaeon]|nr:hypothetical protein [Candidatus Helarchaeota archaeon]
MQDNNEILEWGHFNLKVPYFRLAEEITAAGEGKATSEKIKILFFPFKTEGRIAADVSNHFYPPLMESSVINALMLVTESSKKGILRMYTEEYDIRTLSDDPSHYTPTMFVKDYKPTPPKIETIEKLMQAQKYQEILDFLEKETGKRWNCLKIGSLKMLEEMKLIEDISAKTGDFLAFFFQTFEALQNLYSTGDFYVYPEERFPLFYLWQNYFGYWTRNIDYKNLKLLVSRLLWNQRFNFLLEARGRPIFNLLINVNNGKMSMEMVPPQASSSSDSSDTKAINRVWDSVKSIELLKNLMKSQSLKELFMNSIPYFANLTSSRGRKKKETKPNRKKKRRPKMFGFLSESDMENIFLEFTGDLNDRDKIWTVLLDKKTPLFGIESEIKEGFPAHITGLNEKKLKSALKLAVPSNDIKMKILLDSNYLTSLRTELLKGEIPERLKKIENFFLQGVKIYPESSLIKNIKSKGLLTTLYHSLSKGKKNGK